MKNISSQPKSKLGTKKPEKKSSKRSPLVYIIGIVVLVIIGNWAKDYFTQEPITKYLVKGKMEYFSFNGKLGDRLVVFQATEDDEDFTIITQDGKRAKPANTVTSVLRRHHKGIFVISHNKDTQFTITLE